MRVEPGADGGAAEWNLAEPRQRVVEARNAFPDLRGVAAELLTERDGDGIHPMCAARLHDIGELLRLRLERAREQVERGQKIIRDLVERSEVHRRREDVI